MRRGDCRTLGVRAAAFLALITVQLAGISHADWSDNFNGNTAHNPTNGAGLPRAFARRDSRRSQRLESGLQQRSRERSADVWRTADLSRRGLYLRHHRHQPPLWRRPRRGHCRRRQQRRSRQQQPRRCPGGASDFDSYVLAVDHRNGTINLVKSRDAARTTPTTVTSQQILGYAPTLPFYLVLDVLDTIGGTQLVGRVYEDSSKTNLLNTISAFDDAGNTVPGAPMSPITRAGSPSTTRPREVRRLSSMRTSTTCLRPHFAPAT